MVTLFVDIETKVGHPSSEGLLLVGYAVDEDSVNVLDRGGWGTRTADGKHLDALLAHPGVTKVTQSTYDLRYLKLIGWDVQGDLHNTMVMAHTLDENTPLDLDWLTWHYANLSMDKRLRRYAGRVYFRDDNSTEHDLETIEPSDFLSYVDGPFMRFQAYNARDVDALRKLYQALRERLDESDWLDYFLNEQVPWTNTLVNMETRGLPINIGAVEALAEEYKPEHDRLGAELVKEASLPLSFNLNSGDQLAAYLFGRVVILNDTLLYSKETIACLKSCLGGEHEDCDITIEEWWNSPIGTLPVGYTGYHVSELLPEGFVLDRLGRDRVHGHWTVKGRGLAPTPPTKDKVTGKLGKRPSTSSPELLYMHADDSWVRKLCLEYRKLEKLLTTYLTKWPVEAVETRGGSGGCIDRPSPDKVAGTSSDASVVVATEECTLVSTGSTHHRLYGRFNQTGTVTGRLSSAGPNLQNVPARGERGKACRGLFQGNLVVGDYDQLEMRLMAHFSEDPQMLKVFRNGEDPHLITAQSIFGPAATEEQREIGKTLNFAQGYGAGSKKVAQVLSLAGYPTTKDTAAGYLAEMSRFYRGYFRWKQHIMEKAKRTGNVQTIGGGRRRLRASFKDVANWKLVSYGERQAVNAIIQGSAADIIRRAMVAWDALPLSKYMPMLAQVHDEVIFQHSAMPPSATSLQILQSTFEEGHGFSLRVPLLFEPHAGSSWAAAKDGTDLIGLFEEER